MKGDMIYLSQESAKITNYQCANKKRGGAAPKRHPIALKFFWGKFLSDVIPKLQTEHKLSKLLFFGTP